jgi:hypothetical protein
MPSSGLKKLPGKEVNRFNVKNRKIDYRGDRRKKLMMFCIKLVEGGGGRKCRAEEHKCSYKYMKMNFQAS